MFWNVWIGGYKFYRVTSLSNIDNLGTLNGPFIKVTELNGETSGRFGVARVIARVFPTQKEFAESVIKEDLEPASDFPFSPYPTDTLKYHGDVTVEFQTPANTKGLGTETIP